MVEKKCSSCKEVKPLSEFHSTGYRQTTGGRIRVHKPDCRTCANQKWLQRREENLLLLVKEWKCSICGYDKCRRALEFHHKMQHEKDFIIASSHTRSFERLKQEVEKCILVCANCHREIHDK